MNPLLPDVTRGARVTEFPMGDVVLVELNPFLIGRGWVTSDGTPLEAVEIEIDTSVERTTEESRCRRGTCSATR